MGDFIDPANPNQDPLRSADDNYQNLGPLPYANLDPNAPAGGAVPPPPPQQLVPPPPPPPPPVLKPVPPTPPAGGEPGDGVQELLDSDPSESKKRTDTKKPKINKLKKKMKRVKIIFWIATIIWLLFLAFFIILQLSSFGIHLLPFLTPPKD